MSDILRGRGRRKVKRREGERKGRRDECSSGRKRKERER